jgi:hypothetical protein
MDEQLLICDEKHLFSLEGWKYWGKEIADDLRAKGLEAEETEGQALWRLGDWLLQGEILGKLKEKKLREYAEDVTGYSWGYLKNLKVVSRKFPPAMRRQSLRYSSYRDLTALNQDMQQRVLDKADEALRQDKPMSVREVRVEIKRLTLKPKNPDRPRERPKMVKIPLSASAYDAYQKLAMEFPIPNEVLKQMQWGDMTEVDRLIWTILHAYRALYKDEWKASRQAWEKAFNETKQREMEQYAKERPDDFDPSGDLPDGPPAPLTKFEYPPIPLLPGVQNLIELIRAFEAQKAVGPVEATPEPETVEA